VGCSCSVVYFTAHDVQVDETWVATDVGFFIAGDAQGDERWVAIVVLVGTAHDALASFDCSAVTVRAAIGGQPDGSSLKTADGHRTCNHRVQSYECVSEQYSWSQSMQRHLTSRVVCILHAHQLGCLLL